MVPQHGTAVAKEWDTSAMARGGGYGGGYGGGLRGSDSGGSGLKCSLVPSLGVTCPAAKLVLSHGLQA